MRGRGEPMTRHALRMWVGLTAMVAVGCAGTATSPTSTTATAPATDSPAAAPASSTPATAPARATVAAGTGKLGKFLTDGQGLTLYLFAADTTPTSTCSGACVDMWAPFTTTGAPLAGPGVIASLLATSPRPDGTTQVTYHGHPLYYYIGDTSPGNTTGQAVSSYGAPWYVVAADTGDPIVSS
jgi:predicted lipoprotein with Yx(FWY)xxD motif